MEVSMKICKMMVKNFFLLNLTLALILSMLPGLSVSAADVNAEATDPTYTNLYDLAADDFVLDEVLAPSLIESDITLNANWNEANSTYAVEFPDADFRSAVLNEINSLDKGQRTSSSIISENDFIKPANKIV